jgi:hypothetical protein
MSAMEFQWTIGGLPKEKGWYIVAYKGISSPALRLFDPRRHDNWDRIIAWYGPFIIPMNEVNNL